MRLFEALVMVSIGLLWGVVLTALAFWYFA